MAIQSYIHTFGFNIYNVITLKYNQIKNNKIIYLNKFKRNTF